MELPNLEEFWKNGPVKQKQVRDRCQTGLKKYVINILTKMPFNDMQD